MLVANVNFDDQDLQVLGFHMDIYYLLGKIGWVQFSNELLANTHKELALENLMTMMPILDGVLHFVWKDVKKWFSMSTLESCLDFEE
jgi:hypothetical protein